MKINLVDYQTDTRDKICNQLQQMYGMKNGKFFTSISAPTGAGKTVIATSIIESLLFGNHENDMDKDEDAVILWFSKEPILNVQTRDRILESSSLITSDRLHIIQTSFNEKKLERGKVYFISNGKLASHSNLVKSHKEQDTEEDDLFFGNYQSGQESGISFWDVIRNTNESGARIYLFIDEAHQGMKTPAKSAERSTIIRTLIDGKVEGGAIPVVIGISATIERFQDSMYDNDDNGRIGFKGVNVDITKVRESGLLKDEIVIAGVDNEKFSEIALLRMGAKKLVDYKNAWKEVTENTGESDIEPLMIIQTPNKVDEKTIMDWLNVVKEEIPDLRPEHIANVFGEHAALNLPDGSRVEYMDPAEINDRHRIRVVVAKDAITTGWDCPRAEVLISFRPTKEVVTITQLMGRMVRQPLRRKIQGNDFLNSVYCVLPAFNHKSVSEVASLIKDGNKNSDAIPVESVVIEPTDISLNKVLIDEYGEDLMKLYADKLASLPTHNKPVKMGSHITLLNALVAKLSSNLKEMQEKHGVEKYSDVAYVEKNTQFIVSSIDLLMSEYHDYVDKEMQEIKDLHILHTSLTSDGTKVYKTEKSISQADEVTVDGYFRKADRAMKKSATVWVKNKRQNSGESIYDLKLKIAAFANINAAVKDLEEMCRQRFIKIFRENKHAIEGSADDLKSQYNDLLAQSGEISTSKIGKIVSSQVAFHTIHNGVLSDVDTYDSHILSNDDGHYPKASSNAMEDYVIEKEMSNPYVHTWYRNPPVESKPSLRIARKNSDGSFSYTYPDFVFMGQHSNDEIFASIVDPHGSFLGDNKERMHALCQFVEENGDDFYQIISIADTGKREYRMVDLKEKRVRDAIMEAEDVMTVFNDKVLSSKY